MKRFVETERDGLVLRGYLEIPDAAVADGSGDGLSLLVMFHGFTGTLSEKGFLLSRLSKKVIEGGVATLRFDFLGSGESDGCFSKVTPMTEVNDGLAILRFAATIPGIDRRRISLLGFSLGGFVAMNVAVRTDIPIEKLVLISPATRTHEKMERVLMEEGGARRGSLVVREDFIHDGYALDPFVAATQYDGETLIVQGTDDQAVPAETAAEYQRFLQCSSVKYVAGADHSYGTPEAFEEMALHVVQTVCSSREG